MSLVDIDVSDSEGEGKEVEPEQQWRKSKVHNLVCTALSELFLLDLWGVWMVSGVGLEWVQGSG